MEREEKARQAPHFALSFPRQRLNSALPIAGITLLLCAACGNTANLSTAGRPVTLQQKQPTRSEHLGALVFKDQSNQSRARGTFRRVGELRVRHFQGRTRGEALTLSEEVVERTGGLLVVDYQLDEGTTSTHLRVHFLDSSEQVVQVVRLFKGSFIPATVADWDRMMATTIHAPGKNQRTRSLKTRPCLQKKNEMDCELLAFHNREPSDEARFSNVPHVRPRRANSSRIVAVDGTILHPTDLIEIIGNDKQLGSQESSASLPH